MSEIAMTVLAAAVGAAIVAAGTTPLFARFASSRGLVVAPRSDRWHRAPTPLLGGAAIAVASIGALAAFGDAAAIPVAGAAALAFALGLLDDFRRLSPTSKLVGQAVVASAVAVAGIRVEIIPFAPLAFVVTIVWLVGLMNAFNFMDNMDGLAAGIAAISGAGLVLVALPENRPAALVAAVTAGAAAGFLVHNFHPAKVFMGDAGSQLLGLLLGIAALLHTAQGAAQVAAASLAPLAVLALPIFDTALVAATRRYVGRPISRGGTDHTSHRLAALGLEDRRAVLFLYAVAAILTGVGLLGELGDTWLLPAFAVAVVALVLFGAFLVQVEVYGQERRHTELTPLGRAFVVYGRFGGEVILDTVLLTVAYYAAYLVRFEGFVEGAWLSRFTDSLPVVVGLQLLAMVTLGVYRTLWRYFGVHDAVAIVRAVTAGSAGAALLVLIATRFEGYSRAVFVFDWLIAGALLIAARSFGVWLRHWFATHPTRAERRVLIVGAGDTGALVHRLVQRLTDARYRAVAFLDEDDSKRHRRLGGVPIVGKAADLEEVVGRLRVDVVFWAADDADVSPAEMRDRCAALGLEFRQFPLPAEAGGERTAG